jgi:hypothetical protein
MTRDEVRLAVTGPVAVGGGEIAVRLVTRVLNDVGDHADQLPILQHALMRTWNYWEQHQAGNAPIDLADYEAIGTMTDALSRHAEEAYGELTAGRQQELAEQIFKALTETTAQAGGLRRPCSVGELCQITGATRSEVVEVIDRFRMPGRSFLMPPVTVALEDRTIVDLSHESLMRVWTRLIAWTYEEVRSAEVYRRLSQAAQLHEEGEAGLWRDPELLAAVNWRNAHHPTATWAALRAGLRPRHGLSRRKPEARDQVADKGVSDLTRRVAIAPRRLCWRSPAASMRSEAFDAETRHGARWPLAGARQAQAAARVGSPPSRGRKNEARGGHGQEHAVQSSGALSSKPTGPRPTGECVNAGRGAAEHIAEAEKSKPIGGEVEALAAEAGEAARKRNRNAPFEKRPTRPPRPSA